MRRQVPRFAEQMRKRKSEVKCWIAPMNDFVVQQHQSAAGDEDILWAVIAVNQASAPRPRRGEQGLNEVGCLGNLRRRILVVWLKSQ